MNVREIAVVAVLVLGSLAADNVAPSKAELAAMYDKAFRAFNENNFADALKELDAIDARQPDLAESQNLRGVIMMRERIYDKAEAAMHEALRIDPKFWNAHFNLAEIPFLKKDWAEARNRFQDLLSSNATELQGEATQLIQYKILLTYLLEGKESMVDSILAKFELSPDTPAVHYANAAIALQRNNTAEAKDWMAQAEKNFSPQLNKLFAESLYEVGWLQKQAGETRTAFELTTASERAAKTKAFARSRFEQARQAYQQRDLAGALKFVDDANSADPNQASILNMRGEILLAQKQFDQAEAEFKKALKADPKSREAQFNLAQVPFKKGDYTTARDRFEGLISKTPGGDKSEGAQLLKFNVYMTLLLEGKESRAQKMMEQFQFTGDTPALYYAQAAWEFKHNNPTKATDWITSAKKIYSSLLNLLFADAFYDLGWMQSPALATSPAPAAEAATALAETESGPAIEPSPIPGAALAKNKGRSKAESLAGASPVASPIISGMEATALKAGELPSTALVESPAAERGAFATGTPAKPEEIPTLPAPNFSSVVETTPMAASALPVSTAVPAPVAKTSEQSAVAQSKPATVPSVAASTTPATVLAPAWVGELAQLGHGAGARTLLVAALVLAGLGLLAWVIVPEIRRRGSYFPIFQTPPPATGPRVEGMEFAAPAPVAQKEMKMSPRFSGGPRQVSLKLKASEPWLHRAVVPLRTPSRLFGGAPAVVECNGERAVQPVETSESEFESVAPVIAMAEPAAMVEPEPIAIQPEPAIIETPVSELTIPVHTPEPIHEQWAGLAAPEMQPPVGWAAPVAEMPVSDVAEPAAMVEPEPIAIQPEAEPVFAQAEVINAPEFEPIGQGQPIPQLTLVEEASMIDVTEPEPAGFSEFRPVSEPPFVPEPAIIETPVSELTTPVNMPEPIHEQWAGPAAPEMQPPVGWAAPVAEMPVSDVAEPAAMVEPTAGAVQTAVHLTFAFEIASMQLTPTFKMGALQLRPSSKVVTMRLAGASPSAACNEPVGDAFEIAKIQPAGGSLGSVRLTPSQQQRPTVVGSPSLTVGGLQLVSDFAAAPLQLTPSQQGPATVNVVVPFHIATVEFSPSFEISSIILNSNSKQVSVQLPGVAGAATEGAPIFEIANLQLTGSGEIEMMQLNLLGHDPKRAA